MCDHVFDGKSFELDEMDAFYETFGDLPEHRRLDFLKEVHDLSPIKYNTFVRLRLSRHPEYDPEKYKIED